MRIFWLLIGLLVVATAVSVLMGPAEPADVAIATVEQTPAPVPAPSLPDDYVMEDATLEMGM